MICNKKFEFPRVIYTATVTISAAFRHVGWGVGDWGKGWKRDGRGLNLLIKYSHSDFSALLAAFTSLMYALVLTPMPTVTLLHILGITS